MAAVRPVLYREVLTPSLHRRFTDCSLLVFAFCYIESILLAEKTSFLWTWFPVGPAGIRASLLFISALSIFVLRVASLHLGNRKATSPSTTLLGAVFRLNTYLTFAWYLFSAWWFSEVYVWSASTSSDLGWVTQPKPWERKKLNERPIYLRSVFFILAIAQSVVHLYYDYDQVVLPITKAQNERVTPHACGMAAWISERSRILAPMFDWNTDDWASSIPRNMVLRTSVICVSATFVYQLLIRRAAWSWSLAFASIVWDVPASPLSFIPPHYPSLLWRSITAGLLLVFLWESSSALFSAYVAGQPIKREQPLSSSSTDQNGTLLNGLKSKKEIPNTFALWELSLITFNFLDRRKALFTDIDRKSGPAWTQISIACLNNIKGINSRIQTYLNPPPPSSAQSGAPQQAPQQIESLPRLSTPLRQDNIFSNPSPPSTRLDRIESNIGDLAKSYGQSPNPGTFTVPYSPETKSFLTSSSHKLIASSPRAQKLLTSNGESSSSTPSFPTSKSGITNLIHDYILLFLRSRLGHPFRQSFGLRTSSVILGAPHSNLHQILLSTKSLTALALASLNEDPYGRVSKDVPTIIRTYTSTVQTIEAFVRNLPPHWTDVGFCEETDRSAGGDVEQVVQCLRTGLRELLAAFGQYASELGLGEGEMRIASQVAAAAAAAPKDGGDQE